jgi:hypothetical protein
MFVEWLIEAYYLRMFLQLAHIPHYTTLQKFSSRINGTLLERIISSFILLLSNIRRLFIGIDSTGFKITRASQYYIETNRNEKKICEIIYLLELMCYNKSYVQLRGLLSNLILHMVSPLFQVCLHIVAC